MTRLARYREGHAREVALAAVCAILFLTFLDNTIVSVALAGLQSDLGVSVTGLQWIVNGYMLAFAALMLTGGTLGDLFGRKKVMLYGVGIFCVGSVMSAVATGTNMLIAGRIVMGVGAAASEPGTLSLIRHMYPERRERSVALGVWTAVSGLALALGPVIGGVLIGWQGWRSVFWFGVAFAAVAFAVAAVTLTESSDPWLAVGERSTSRASGAPPPTLPAQRRKLDIPGLVVGAGAILTATFAVIEGENGGYGAWWISGLFALSVVLAWLFVVVERRSPDPVLKIEFLRDPTFTSANFVAFAANLSIFSVFFFTALYLQLISHFSGFRIALAFASLAVSMIVAGLLAGQWTARVGPRVPMVLGCALSALGLLLVDWKLTVTTSVGALAWTLAIAGLGFGITLVSVTGAVLGSVPPEQSGMAASTVNTSRELGGVFGVAVLGSVVNNQLTAGLSDKLAKIRPPIPPSFRDLVIQIVTTGGSTKAADYPVARGHLKEVQQVFDAAAGAAGNGIHLSLRIGAGVVLAAAVVALFASRRVAKSI